MVHAPLRLVGAPQALVGTEHFGGRERRAETTAELPERPVGDARHRWQQRLTGEPVVSDRQAHGIGAVAAVVSPAQRTMPCGLARQTSSSKLALSTVGSRTA